MTLYDNLLTVGVLLAIVIIVYLKATNRTLLDLFRDIKEIMSDSKEEAIAYE